MEFLHFIPPVSRIRPKNKYPRNMIAATRRIPGNKKVRNGFLWIPILGFLLGITLSLVGIFFSILFKSEKSSSET